MIVRTASTLAALVLVVSSSALVGCAAAADEDVAGSSSRIVTGKGEGDDNAESNGKPGADNNPEPDAECVSVCNERLKARCGWEDDFCSSVCAGTPKSQVLCVAQASSCEKTEWIRCAPEDSEIEGTEPAAPGTGGKPSLPPGDDGESSGKPGADEGSGGGKK